MVAFMGAPWVRSRRRRYRSAGAPLPTSVAAELRPYFGAELLDATRLTRVQRIATPLGGILDRLTPAGALDLSTVRGMAFIDTIVVADANTIASDREASLLFHEMVHIAQFHLLGTTGFIRAYLDGWLRAGRSYLDNPLESMAFELQDRFDAHDAFDALTDVRDRLSRL